MKIEFSTQLKELRKKKQMSQEQLAEVLGITPQAVSKYECAQSYPDIEMLPKIADAFGVTIDYLLRGRESRNTETVENETVKLFENFPQDDVLRIVQVHGNTILREHNYNPDFKIPLEIPEEKLKIWQKEAIIKVQIWGSADITGDINGGVTAGNSVNVTNGCISGGVSAACDVNCGVISGGAIAGCDINCGPVSGGVNAGTDVNCGDVSGGVNAGTDVNCGNVSGGVNADTVTCGNVDGEVHATDIECNIIKKDCKCDGDIHCQVIEGNVICKGDIYYES